MALWKSVVGKLWMTIILLVAIVLIVLGAFLLEYIDATFNNSYDVKKLFVYTGIIGFLLTTFFAFFLSTRITKPLMYMKKAADLISHGDYSIRVPVDSSDEIGQLSNTMNFMAEKLEGTIHDLSLERDRLSSVIRSMTDAVITFDAAGTVILANPHGGLLLEEWSHIRWDEEQPIPKDRIPEPLMSVYHAVQEQGVQINSKLHVNSGVWSVVMAPLYTNSIVRGAVAVLRNVTEEFLLEKLRKDFVVNVSHELRTPLSMLQGYSEALLDDIAGTPEERKELAQVIHDESLRMGRLVGDLLDLAKMEAGRLDLKRERVDVQHILTRVVRKFSVLCKERGIKLTPNDPSERLILDSADEDRIEQVLTNLLDNAVRHSKKATHISIQAQTIEIDSKSVVQLIIQDQGQGIDETSLPYIFDRFYKADKARTRGSSGGTGLGLAIVKNIVDAHRGTIEVQSIVKQGTTFTVQFPVK
ncbi:MAG: ATP-binding protein [Paenibacillaceae bacterium]